MKTLLELFENWTWVVCFMEAFNVPLSYVYSCLTQYKNDEALLIFKTPILVSRYSKTWWKLAWPLFILKILVWFGMLVVGWKVLAYCVISAFIIRTLIQVLLSIVGFAGPPANLQLLYMPVSLAILGLSMLIMRLILK
jgi:hypothetical protein